MVMMIVKWWLGSDGDCELVVMIVNWWLGSGGGQCCFLRRMSKTS